jgi:hypothetical protein
MLHEHYIKILDELTEWRVGVDSYFKTKVAGRPRKDETDNEHSNPINGYPVVTGLKVIATPCEWCTNSCTQEKTYRRSINSNLWTGKCQDCGETRNFHTSQINRDK